MDAALAPTASGRQRSSSFFQVAGIAPATGAASVSGNFPSPTSAQVSSGAVAGLVKSPSGTSALVDGGAGTAGPSSSSSSGGGASQYPGCDTPDIVLANGQKWAACNVGATTAYAGQVYPSGTPTTAQKAYVGAYFQWGRNDDLTAGTTTTTRAPAGTLAGGVGHSNFITGSDWIATANGNLWGGGSTSLGSGFYSGQAAADQAAMKGPCAVAYHVPTQAEWYSAMNTLHAGLTNTSAAQNDTVIATTLKLPLAGYKDMGSGVIALQGAY